MSRRALFTILGFVSLAAGLAAAQELKCEKYTLPNGMTVILHEDRTLPAVSVNIWYRVGSLDEPPGRTGFAHLFEHLMFMGTKRVPGNAFDVLMETGGGANNASTALYRTNYFSWGPSKLLPTLLWLDADRLEHMGLNMTQEKLDKQRDVVRNELRQGVENAPYGKAEIVMFNLMYPAEHPYHNPVIGTHEDLENASLTNVKDFFANFYVPNNASLVVAGDFNAAEIRPLIDQLFGGIPRGAELKRRSPPRPKLDGVKRFTMLDKVQLPKIIYAWHSPSAYAEGDAELRLAAAVLAEGKSSRLYKRLVMDDQTCTDVNVQQQGSDAGSLFTVEIYTKPNADLDAVEKAADEELAKLAEAGPTADELAKRQATIELRMLSSLQSVRARADQLNEYEYFWGNPNSLARDLDRFRKATPETVKSWVQRVCQPDARAIIRVLPEEPQRPESPRDKRPVDFAAKAFAPPPPQTFKLSSGVPVLLWTRSDLPLVAMTLVSRPGRVLDTPQQAGLATLVADMLDEGTEELDALQFSQALQALGASFSASADRETMEASLTVLKRNFDRGAKLLADAVLRPRLAEADWARVKSLHLDELRQSSEEPAVVAARVAARLCYGEKHPYCLPTDGLIETVEPLKLDDVRAARAALLRAESATILAAGDITPDQAKATLEELFGGWTPSQSPAATPGAADFAMPKGDALRIAIVDRPNAVQTVIRFEMPGVKYADPRRPALRMLNTILGGSFTSRLNQNLREDKGYTYGARSRFDMQPSAGSVSATAAVQAETTGPALKEFFYELERIRKGDISEAEVEKARETQRQDVVDAFQGLGGLLSTAAELLAGGVPFETLAADLAAMEKVSAGELNTLAGATLPLEQGVLVLVGDKKLILEHLAKLESETGRKLPPPLEVDATGRTVREEN